MQRSPTSYILSAGHIRNPCSCPTRVVVQNMTGQGQDHAGRPVPQPPGEQVGAVRVGQRAGEMNRGRRCGRVVPTTTPPPSIVASGTPTQRAVHPSRRGRVGANRAATERASAVSRQRRLVCSFCAACLLAFVPTLSLVSSERVARNGTASRPDSICLTHCHAPYCSSTICPE